VLEIIRSGDLIAQQKRGVAHTRAASRRGPRRMCPRLLVQAAMPAALAGSAINGFDAP
jgi:hypothetical protein